MNNLFETLEAECWAKYLSYFEYCDLHSKLNLKSALLSKEGFEEFNLFLTREWARNTGSTDD